jgi:hypothetical protein
MKKLSGWQKVGLFAGVGCFSIIAIVVVGFAIAVAYARSTLASLGDTTPTRVERAVVIQPPTAEAPAPGAKAEATSAGEPMRLRVELQEGTFDIKPGQPNGRVQVEGEFSEALYELTERTDIDNGKPRTTIRFRSKAPAWARMLSGIGNGGNDRNRPSLTVLIPTGVPIDLSLQVSVGQSTIDLGGLTLTELGLDLSMGDHEVDFREPLVAGLQRFRLDASMGNVSVENLGNAGAKTIDTTGNMGNVTADLGGAWRQGSEAELSFTQSMGEVRLKVPTRVRLEADVRNAEGKKENVTDADQTTDPKAPLLRVRVSTSMGDSRVTRY